MNESPSEPNQVEPRIASSSRLRRVGGALLLVGAVAVVAVSGGGPRSDPGTVFEEREFSLDGFTVRVVAARENFHWGPIPLPTVVPGGHYRFEANTGDDTVEAMTFRHDDPLPVPDECVVQVNKQVAFVFMGWKYAVTTDAGVSWSVWDAALDLPGFRAKEHANYRFIDSVTLNADGNGIMHINPIRWPPDKTLVTRDFGRSWQRNPGTPPGK